MVLSNRSKRAWREIDNPYEIHRTIMNAFPEDIPGDERVLFRIEGPLEEGIVILVQSKRCPDWSAMNVGNDFLADWPAIKEFDPKFFPDQHFRFRLLANPTRKVMGKRLGELGEENALDWLERKANAGGFELSQVQVIPKGFVRIKAKERAMSLYSVLFDGSLKVSNPSKFTTTYEVGIGSGKGFGYGLLSLARGRIE